MIKIIFVLSLIVLIGSFNCLPSPNVDVCPKLFNHVFENYTPRGKNTLEDLHFFKNFYRLFHFIRIYLSFASKYSAVDDSFLVIGAIN